MLYLMNYPRQEDEAPMPPMGGGMPRQKKLFLD